MSRLGMFLVGALALGLTACGGPEQAEDGTEPQMASAQQELTQYCGLNCPSGQHPTTYLCSSSCGSFCTNTNNAVQCDTNAGSSFTSCGTTCPSPYHVTSTYGSYNCSKTIPYLSGNNTVICSL
ncbi:hypothetical protein HMI49_06875 [Corallococcus exercitus]|uniref:Lipoprotein n=1 Tax=Corallococcus exercitus TaxID=2316736 RepID=A0A7Y4KFK9_9BACT|nr:hypothetical protein [Corallococcus exercitus]NOK32920.1 hypothetical protein [Corallococcus exercitus]